MGKSKKAGRKSETKKTELQSQEQTPEAESPAAHESAAAEPVGTTRKAKKEFAPKAPREERNGVKRPGPGKCLEVWEHLDQRGDLDAKDLKAVAVERGWNANNAVIELYRWRKFNGVTRAATR